MQWRRRLNLSVKQVSSFDYHSDKSGSMTEVSIIGQQFTN